MTKISTISGFVFVVLGLLLIHNGDLTGWFSIVSGLLLILMRVQFHQLTNDNQPQDDLPERNAAGSFQDATPRNHFCL